MSERAADVIFVFHVGAVIDPFWHVDGRWRDRSKHNQRLTGMLGLSSYHDGGIADYLRKITSCVSTSGVV